jgi:hypothetical protein
MAILSAEQFKYTGKGPLDAKSLVGYYADLLSADTWTENGAIIAYNGMIVAVWRDTDDNNGIYFLHDKAVTKPIHKPNVADPANWHKLGGINDLPGLNEQLAEIQASIEMLEGAATVVVDTTLPEEGIAGKLYVVASEATTYIWHNGKYLPVGDGNDDETEDIRVINGGSAKN